jgi:hypothetical protein
MTASDQGRVVIIHIDPVPEMPEEMGQDRAGLVDPLAGSSPDQDRDFFMSIPHDTLIGSGWYILFVLFETS